MKKIFTKRNTSVIFSGVVTILLSGVLIVSAAAPVGGYLPGTTLDPDCAPGSGGVINPCLVQSVATTVVTSPLIAAGYVLTADGNGSTSWTSLPAAPVTSVFGRTGSIIAQSGDYTTDMVSEGTQKYFTESRVLGTVLQGLVPTAGTPTASDTVLSALAKITGTNTNQDSTLTLLTSSSHAPVTLGSANGLTLSGQQMSLGLSSAITPGALSATDWNIFNNKEDKITFNTPLLRTGNTVSLPAADKSTDGYLSQTDWNTFSTKQDVITVTTVGTTGAATLVGNVLNIPNYGSDKWSLAGNDGVTAGTNFIGTIDNTALHLKTNGADAFVIDNTQNILFTNYSNTRDDSTITTPINFLYTDASGKLQSAPVSLLGTGGPALQYYAENSAAPSISPIATGVNSIAIGSAAAAVAADMFVAGRDAGKGSTGSYSTVFLGDQAGLGATGAYGSVFVGSASGSYANATSANFFGSGAGQGTLATPNVSSASNFFGTSAGSYATNAFSSNFFGNNSGVTAANANNSNFFGSYAGRLATNASHSNFFGNLSGEGGTNANNSNFFGRESGRRAANSANSIYIGSYAGINTGAGTRATVNNTATFDESTTFANTSIAIGHRATPGAFSNSIAIGAYAKNTASNQLIIGSNGLNNQLNNNINNTRGINEVKIFGNITSTDVQCTITVGTGISCTSDEQLKKNITDLSDGTLTKLLNVKTATYNWLGDETNSNLQVGFIAQNLEQYFPQLVTTNSDGYKSVYYAQMTPILVQAIRELNTKVDTAILTSGNTSSTGFFDALKNWLASTTNGLTEIFADRIRAKNEICIDDVCMTRDQLRALLHNTAGSTGSTTGGSDSTAETAGDDSAGGSAGTTPDTTDTVTLPSDTSGSSDTSAAPAADTPSDTTETPIDTVTE